jgi:hypothetical protein
LVHLQTMNKINDTIATYQQAHISSGPRSPANSQPPSATSSRAGSSSSIPHSTMPSQVQRTQRTRHGDATLIAGLDAPLPTRTYPDEMYAKLPKIVNLFPNEEGRVVQRRILEPRHFVCLTIGSRGDVQPVCCPFFSFFTPRSSVSEKSCTEPSWPDAFAVYRLVYRPDEGRSSMHDRQWTTSLHLSHSTVFADSPMIRSGHTPGVRKMDPKL